ncbi:hypothetical protein GCM10027280_45620 [Micromonospora polyrhachis]|uniref:Uncharacterized protein n=1 Tax=Micromonospora polyrhachis TaxID=1282883 RepID=A0A7W7WPP6_9ACTN|nr:hypothetical protein [Micromonospora polyrhachis]MBB4958924.1 hypothetical protein [Micromonospora polyrhachis]
MTTTANPTPTTADDDQTLTTWCAQVAASHHNYETREWMHYETQDIRDRALVKWTIRCLGNTGYSAAENTRRVVSILAERHALLEWLRAELADAHDGFARLTAELAEARKVALIYRDAMVSQHEWGGHLVEGNCADCTRAAEALDGSLACDRYRQWQRQYVDALDTHLPQS